MKKLIVLALVLALVLGLSACSGKDQATPAASPTPEPLEGLVSGADVEPAATPLAGGNTFTTSLPDDTTDPEADDGLGQVLNLDDEPLPDEGDDGLGTTPADTPATEEVKLKDYQLIDYTDEDMQVSLLYPSHWDVEPGVNTVSFIEPAPANNKPAMRIAVTCKESSGKATSASQKKEFTAYLKAIKSTYGQFKTMKKSNKLVFMNRASLSTYYAAKLNGENVRGFVIMTSVPRTNKIYALHFYAPQSKFKNANTFFKKVLYSVKATATTEPAASPAA